MDSEELGQVVSTTVIYAVVAFVVAPNFGYGGFEDRATAAVVAAVVLGLPLAAFAVFVHDGEESFFFGPWGPEDLVFLLGTAVVLAGVVYGTTAAGIEGTWAWILYLVGAVVAVAAGVVVRDATVGEWPPGSGLGGRGDGERPGSGRGDEGAGSGRDDGPPGPF